MKSLGWLLMMVLFLVGCGTSPLTDEQKAQYKTFNKAVGNTHGSAARAGRETANRNSRSSLSIIEQQDEKNVSLQMEEYLQEAECVPTVNEDLMSQFKNNGDFTLQSGMNYSGEFSIKLDQASCPLTMDFDLSVESNMSQNGGSFNIGFIFKYEVIDEEFKKLNDVVAIDISGDGSANISASEQSASMDMDFQIGGTVTSTKYSDPISFNVEISGDMSTESGSSSGSAEMVYTTEFPEFTAELKVVVEQDENEMKKEFSLNGEELTEEQFMEYITAVTSLEKPKKKVNRTTIARYFARGFFR